MITSFFYLKELERWFALIVAGISKIFPILRAIAVVDPAFPNVERMKDFFISYSKADQVWAEWIAWILEEAGLSVIIQAWDFRPGGNFILNMQRAASLAEKTIVVLSPTYLQSEYTQPEWGGGVRPRPSR